LDFVDVFRKYMITISMDLQAYFYLFLLNVTKESHACDTRVLSSHACGLYSSVLLTHTASKEAKVSTVFDTYVVDLICSFLCIVYRYFTGTLLVV